MKRALIASLLVLATTACAPSTAATQYSCGNAPGFCPNPRWPYSAGPDTATIPPYHRDAFGNGWAIARGKCDTRELVLERDAGPAAVDTDGDGCKDDAPIKDLYTGLMVEPSHVDADHVTALGDAWASGAWKWTAAQRRAFSQDQANLRAVGASINRSKGERGPDTWKPPDHTGWCTYGHIYQDTKQRWHLAITPAQSAAVAELLKTCPGGT